MGCAVWSRELSGRQGRNSLFRPFRPIFAHADDHIDTEHGDDAGHKGKNRVAQGVEAHDANRDTKDNCVRMDFHPFSSTSQ